ncbi:MAG: DUF2807 domain-containing protein [Chitinophagaceae bacterium]|nr:DUF2807 domain-containing protein [Chitinophagaceae bacterium]
MRIVFALFLLITTFPAAAQLVIQDPNAEIREVKDFNSIVVSGPIDVLLTHGDQNSLVVSVSDYRKNALIQTDVSDNTLKISLKPAKIRINNKVSYKVYISYKQLESLTASGACSAAFADPFTGEKLFVQLSGASSIKGNINTSRLRAKLSGASDASFDGSADELKLDCSGASDFKSYNLTVEKFSGKLSGASDAKITVTASVAAEITGASDLFIKGNPPMSDVKKSGTASVKFID